MENISNIINSCDKLSIIKLVREYNYLENNYLADVILFIILSLFFFYYISRIKLDYKLGIIYYIYNKIIFSFFIYYSLKNPSDAVTYYFLSYHNVDCDYFTSFFSYNNFILLNKYILNFYNFSYISMNLLFNFFALLFHLRLYQYLINISNIKYLKYLFLFLLFLPSINFFTSSISKEVIIYSALILILTSLKFEIKNLFFIILSLIAILLFRPYVLLFILLSIFFTTLIYSFYKRKTNQIFLLIFSSTILIFFNDFFLEAIDFKYTLSLDSIYLYLSQKNNIIYDNQTLLMLVFYSFKTTFLFILSPIFNELKSYFSIVYLFETFFLLAILFLIMISMIKFNFADNFLYFLLILSIFTIIYIISISLITNNMGMIVRYKIILFPILCFILSNFRANKK